MGQRYKIRMSEYKKGNNLFNFFKQIKIKDNGCWEWRAGVAPRAGAWIETMLSMSAKVQWLKVRLALE